MARERAIIVFEITQKQLVFDLEIPLDITANELVNGLNKAFELGIDVTDIKKCYLKAEKPIVLLRGNRTLAEFGIRNGSIIYYTE